MIWLDIIFIITIVICMVLGIILFVDDKLKKSALYRSCFVLNLELHTVNAT